MRPFWISRIRWRFADRAQFHEFGKRLVGLFGGGQFDGLPERCGLLAADGRQLAEAVGRILFDNAKSVATGDGRMLASVATKDDAKILPFGPLK